MTWLVKDHEGQTWLVWLGDHVAVQQLGIKGENAWRKLLGIDTPVQLDGPITDLMTHL